MLVEGYVRGTDENHDRELFAFLRGVFIARRDVRGFAGKFHGAEYLGNDAIPEGASETYLYGGEAGRRQNFARHLRQLNGQYRRQTERAFDRHWNHLAGIEVEIPYIHFGWESYHSPHNDFSDFYFPAPSLIQRLRLASRNREIDFYDSEGNPGTLYREGGDGWKGDRHSLLYVRADLLRRYLSATCQVLIWCNWGERDWLKKMDGHEVLHESARQRIYQTYGHLHRSLLQWRGQRARNTQSGAEVTPV